MQLRVEKIASIIFRHEYFKTPGLDWNVAWPDSYTADQIPKLEATPKTKITLGNLGFYVRNTDRGIDIYTSVREAGAEFELEKNISSNPILDFYLKAPSPEWKVFTKMLVGENGLAYYSNLNGLKTNQGLYLHNEIALSAPGEKEPGTLVRSGTAVYESLKRTNSQPPGADWINLGAQTNFTTLSNQLKYNAGFLRLNETSLAGATVVVKDRYEKTVFSKTFPSTSQERVTNLAIDHLREGVYTWFFNGGEKETFYLSSSFAPNTIGILSIYLQQKPTEIPASKQLGEEWLPVANGNGALNSGIINPREFNVHFLAKRALWKYSFSREISLNVSDIPSTYEKINPTTYQSKQPIEINKTAIGEDFGLDERLPAAHAGILTPQLNASEEIESYVSEIFVNV